MSIACIGGATNVPSIASLMSIACAPWSAASFSEIAVASSFDFVDADAATYAGAHDAPELVIVNPPRRGLGVELATWLEHSPVTHLLYSSCDATTLASDLRAVPSLRVVHARGFAMFPQTRHAEVLVLARRGG